MSDDYVVPKRYNRKRNNHDETHEMPAAQSVTRAIMNVMDEGSPVPFSATLNFVGDMVRAKRNENTGTIDIEIGQQFTDPTTIINAFVSGDPYSCGANGNGQLGTNDVVNRDSLEQVHGALDSGFLAKVKAVSAGDSFSVFVLEDGTVWTCGKGNNHQLGNGGSSDSHVPVQATGLTTAVTVASGQSHTVVLLADGSVWAFGSNLNGQLGDGTTTARSNPVQVTGISGVKSVGAGTLSSYAVLADGTIWAWGANGDGQLGDGTTTGRPAPVQVSGITNAVLVCGGYNHTVALKKDGTVWCWGRGTTYGQLGNGLLTSSYVPVQASIAGCVYIAASYFGSFAVKGDGTAWAWGRNNGAFGASQQLGNGSSAHCSVPTQVSTIDNAISIFSHCGRWGAIALTSEQTAWCWGYNAYGQIGDNTATARDTPVKVRKADDSGDFQPARAAASGFYHSVLVSFPPDKVTETTTTIATIDHALLKNRAWHGSKHTGQFNAAAVFGAAGSPWYCPIAVAGPAAGALVQTEATGRVAASLLPFSDVFVDEEVPSGTVDGSNDTFTLAYVPSPSSSLKVYLNGERLKLGLHYSYALVAGVATLTFLTGYLPLYGDELIVEYRR